MVSVSGADQEKNIHGISRDKWTTAYITHMYYISILESSIFFFSRSGVSNTERANSIWPRITMHGYWGNIINLKDYDSFLSLFLSFSVNLIAESLSMSFLDDKSYCNITQSKHKYRIIFSLFAWFEGIILQKFTKFSGYSGLWGKKTKSCTRKQRATRSLSSLQQKFSFKVNSQI